jgi:hypothetical protein
LGPLSTTAPLATLNTILALAVAALFLPTCSTRRTPECEAFLALPPKERAVQIRSYDPDKQIDMYLCGMKERPPDSGLAYDIAERGSEVVGPSVEKLKKSTNEIEQQDLIYLLEVISDRGYLRGRKDVVATISDVIDTMKITSVKENSQESLKKIQISSGVKPFTYVQ